MSHNEEIASRIVPGEDIPRVEPWLVVSLCSLLPAAGLFVLPPSAMLPLIVVMGVLLLTGIGMFLRDTRRRAP